ncbi:MAG: DPP IV N-terminal domain-containing protein [Phototrophicaceae bacterium]
MTRNFIVMVFIVWSFTSFIVAQDTAVSGGYIAFVADAENNTDIFVADLSNGQVRNLTNNQVQSVHPSWSGDYLQMTFTNVLNSNNPEVFVMDANGLGQRNVSNHPAFDVSPDWSPVSDEIAFMSNRNGGFDLYVLDITTEETRRITEDGLDKNRPAWSPDGSQIAYWQIEGDAVILKVASLVTGEINTLISEGQNLWPAWSPDGSQIAVHSEENSTTQIYVIDITSGERTQITNDEFTNFRPEWSPDGSQIVFVSNRSGDSDLYIMNADGSNIRPLIESVGEQFSPAWRPQQPEIDFAANPSIGQSAVRVADQSISGDEQTELGEGRYRLFAPMQANVNDVIRIRLELELLDIEAVPETDIPLRQDGDIAVYRYMGAEITGLDLDKFEIFPDPMAYVLQIQEDDTNYWEWYLRPKGNETLGQSFLAVEVYLPDIADDGVVTKEVLETIIFDVDVISEEPEEIVEEPATEGTTKQVIRRNGFTQATVQPDPTEGVAVYLNSENLLAISFSEDVDVSSMRVASESADYPLVQLFPDIELAFNNTVPAGFCVFYERSGSSDIPPLSCERNNSLQRFLNSGDVFWFSIDGSGLQDVIIRFNDRTYVCSPRFARCDF